ncbi:MAG: hypothetical protein WEB57_00650 [Pseudohongiellaceae bacterium]
MDLGELEHGQRLSDRLLGQLGILLSVGCDQQVESAFCFLAVESIEHPTDGLGDFALHRLAWYVFLGILLNVELEALPRHRGEDGLACDLQSFVGIGDEQLLMAI